MDPHVRPPGFRHNAPTQPFPDVRGLAVDLRQAYVFARDLVRMHPEPMGRPGHRLVWVRRASFASTALVAGGDAYAIVGRHTQCMVPLVDDPSVALRHLLIRSTALSSGGVALRVVDLQTSLGFVLPDGTRHTSIFAEGPVAIAIGTHALVALPRESSDDELPRELPAPLIETPPDVRDRVASLARGMSPYRQNARPPNRISRITLMPRPVMIGEPLPPTLGRLATGGQWALTLERASARASSQERATSQERASTPDRSATVMLSDDDLLRGVIVGRSEKCHSELLRRITDVNTSRTHVLVLRDVDGVVAYDLASTQGTFLQGAPVRRTVLSDRGACLTLGRGDNAVRMLWQRMA